MVKKIKTKLNLKLMDVVLLIILLVYTISLLSIIIWGLYTSVKSFEEFRTNIAFPPRQNIMNWEWSNFKVIFERFQVRVVTQNNQIRYVGVLEQFYNSIIYALLGSFISTFVTCIMAYAVAMFDYKFSKIIYAIVLITMILPIVGSYPSELTILKNLGMYDRMWGILFQKANFLGLYFLVFHAQFKSLPKAYTESAHMDGASELTIMLKIIFPLVKNTFFTVMLIKFVENWNDYQGVLLFLPSRPTLSYGLYELSRNTVGELSTVPMRMASVVILIVPIILLFIAFRNRLLSNLTVGGIKE